MISQILSAMRDVDGVHGSFVVTKAGALAGKDLPPMFDDAVLTEVGRRVVRLHDGLSAGGQEFDHCVMRFADHKLYLRSVANGFLCVLSTNSVNTPALKMALTLTSRRVDPLISDAATAPLTPSVVPPRPSEAPKSFGPASSAPASSAPALGAPASAAPASGAPASGEPARRPATYRGHRV